MNNQTPRITHLSVGETLMEIKDSEYGLFGTRVIAISGNNNHARIWFRLVGERGEIAGMYVAATQRRRGLATKLFEGLRFKYPEVRVWTTPSATPSGRGWLLSHGFQRPTEPHGEWTLDTSKKMVVLSRQIG